MWLISSFVTINVTAASLLSGTGTVQSDSNRAAVSESMLKKLPVHVRPYAGWSGTVQSAERPNEFDPDAAVATSLRWLAAVLSDDWREELKTSGVAAIPRGVDDHDITVVEIEIEGMRLRAVQTLSRIVLIIRETTPGEEGVRENLDEYLQQLLEGVLRHRKAIVFLSRISVSPSAAEAVIDDRLFDEEGNPLSEEEDREISKMPQPQQSERIAELRARRTDRLLELDPTLPRTLTGGVGNYWWGQVYAATDGNSTVIALGKGYGGKLRAFTSPTWFTRPPDGKRVPAPEPPRERASDHGK